MGSRRRAARGVVRWAAIVGVAAAAGCGGGGDGDDGVLSDADVYLKASNTDAGDEFGSSVALSGDTLVVGAPGEDSAAAGVNPGILAELDDSAADSGAAYVFVRSGDTWTQQAYLKASNPDAGDGFGSFVAIDGDTIVVGALFEDSVATGVDPGSVAEANDAAADAGAAYVFVRSGTTWTQQAYLKASNTDAGDFFGRSVAVSGDTVAVGAPLESSGAVGVNPGTGAQADDGSFRAGAAYVFVRSGTTWTQQAYVKASNTDGDDRFGHLVALSGDTLAVSAVREASAATGVNPGGGAQADDSAPAAGAVYVFARSGSVWAQQAYVKASNAGASDFFGFALAVSGDTLLAGADFERSAATGVNPGAAAEADDSLTAAGAAYLFERSGSTWTQAAYLKASNTGEGDHFGSAVALSGDLALVGAIGEGSGATGVDPDPPAQDDDSADSAGAAYLFLRSGGAWTQTAYVKASNTTFDDAFGRGVAVWGALVVVGAPRENGGGFGVDPGPAAEDDESAGDAGAAYAYR